MASWWSRFFSKYVALTVVLLWFSAHRIKNTLNLDRWSEIVAGHGEKPFQYRWLVPGLFGGAYSLMAGPLNESHLHALFGALDGIWLGVAMVFLWKSLPDWEETRDIVKYFGCALLFLITTLHYVLPQHINIYCPFDVASVMFSTILIFLSRKQSPGLFLLVFTIATVNRETILFLLPLIYWYSPDRGRGTGWRWAVLGAVLWASVKIALAWRFRDNPGASASLFVVEEGRWRIFRNLSLFVSSKILVVCGIGGFLWVVPVFLRKYLSQEANRLSLIYLPYFAVMLFVANLDEVRIYSDMIPVLVLQVCLLINRNIDLSWTPSRTARE